MLYVFFVSVTIVRDQICLFFTLQAQVAELPFGWSTNTGLSTKISLDGKTRREQVWHPRRIRSLQYYTAKNWGLETLQVDETLRVQMQTFHWESSVSLSFCGENCASLHVSFITKGYFEFELLLLILLLYISVIHTKIMTRWVFFFFDSNSTRNGSSFWRYGNTSLTAYSYKVFLILKNTSHDLLTFYLCSGRSAFNCPEPNMFIA